MKTTLRIPAKSTQISGGHLGYGVDILASVRLDLLADALGRMEHDDTIPGERLMTADQCRDALLRELLGGWRWPELVLARIPAIVEMQNVYSEIRRQLTKADNELHRLRPLEMLAARVDAPILDQAIEKIRAQAEEIAALRRERDEARAILRDVSNFLQEKNVDVAARMADDIEERIRPYGTTPTPGAQA